MTLETVNYSLLNRYGLLVVLAVTGARGDGLDGEESEGVRLAPDVKNE
jgi:hypothetical protein